MIHGPKKEELTWKVKLGAGFFFFFLTSKANPKVPLLDAVLQRYLQLPGYLQLRKDLLL
jgi:hypothetical protein